jgi:hypothetical protein
VYEYRRQVMSPGEFDRLAGNLGRTGWRLVAVFEAPRGFTTFWERKCPDCAPSGTTDPPESPGWLVRRA